MKSYTKKEIAERSGLTLRQVQFYTEQGAVIPEEEKGEGRGKVRRYSKTNLLHFLLIKELIDYGMILGTVKTVLSNLRNRESIGLSQSLFVSGFPCYLLFYKDRAGVMRQAFKRVDDGQILDIKKMQEYSSVLVIDFTKLVNRAFGQ